MVYVKAREARKQLGVTSTTLRHWAETGIIKFIRVEGGNRLYDVAGFISSRETHPAVVKKSYIYCRVSCGKQKEDLNRQVKYLQEKYPNHEVVKDTASGINFKRKGLNKILANIFEGTVQEVVVAHRDMLCRIAWEHFEWLFKYHNVNLIVEDKQEYSPESELGDDLLSIVHVFSSRHYGIRRKYTSRKPEETKTQGVTEV